MRDMMRDTLAVLDRHGYYPPSVTVSSRDSGGSVQVGSESLVEFGSNDYLGLSRDSRVVDAARSALLEWGVGSGGSRLTAGEATPHRLAERRIAQFKGTEDAILFSAGFLANSGVLPALLCSQARSAVAAVSPDDEGIFKDTEVFIDQLVHASILDGLAAATSRMYGRGAVSFHVFRHRDVDHLDRLLSKSTASNRLVITDGIFSLHGRVAPLSDLAQVCERRGALLYVDDAHGFGVFGPNGRGVAEAAHVDEAVDFPVGTLSKAVGVAGGYLAGTTETCRYMRICARTYMYQTAMPAAMAMAVVAAIDVMAAEPQRRQRVLELSSHVRDSLTNLGFDIFGSQSQIIPVKFRTHEKATVATGRLRELGILAPAYWYPAVGRDEAMIRVNITYLHTDAQIADMLDALAQVGRELEVVGV